MFTCIQRCSENSVGVDRLPIWYIVSRWIPTVNCSTPHLLMMW